MRLLVRLVGLPLTVELMHPPASSNSSQLNFGLTVPSRCCTVNHSCHRALSSDRVCTSMFPLLLPGWPGIVLPAGPKIVLTVCVCVCVYVCVCVCVCLFLCLLVCLCSVFCKIQLGLRPFARTHECSSLLGPEPWPSEYKANSQTT